MRTHALAQTKVSELLCSGRFCQYNKWCHHKRKCSYHHSLLTSAATPETHSCFLTWKIRACFDKTDTAATHVGSTHKFTTSLCCSRVYTEMWLGSSVLTSTYLIVAAGSCWNYFTSHSGLFFLFCFFYILNQFTGIDKYQKYPEVSCYSCKWINCFHFIL